MYVSTSMGSDEYTVAAAFLCGLLFHSFMLLRSFRGIGMGLAIFIICAVTVVFIPVLAEDTSEDPPELFSLMAGTAFLYALVFSIVYKSRLMPVLTTDGLAHYTLLAYYGIALSARDANVSLPMSILIVGSLPAIYASLLMLWGHRAGPWLKKVSYAWFLFMLIVLTGIELTLLAEHGPKRGQVSLLEAAAWFFLLGPFFMYLVSLVVYLLLMLPQRSHRSWFWYTFAGEHRYEKTYDAALREEAVRRTITPAVTPLRFAILLAHGAIITTNFYYGFVSHGVLISLSIVVLVQVESLLRQRMSAEHLTAEL